MSRRVTKLVQPTSEERFWLGSVILLMRRLCCDDLDSTMNHTQLEHTLICETKCNRSGGQR
jgi:hypothetical protein